MVQEGPYHVQFKSDGPTVVVRNTFLDCDYNSVPKLPVLERGRTAPPIVTQPEAGEGQVPEAPSDRVRRGRRRHQCAALAIETRQAVNTSGNEVEQQPTEEDDELAANGDSGRPSLSPVPPSPVELVRMSTFDPFEDPAPIGTCRGGGAEASGMPHVKTFDPFEEQWMMDQGAPWACPGSYEMSPFMMMPVAMPAAEGPASIVPGEWLPAEGPHVAGHDFGEVFVQPTFEALPQAVIAPAEAVLTPRLPPSPSAPAATSGPAARLHGSAGTGGAGPGSEPVASVPQPQTLERSFSKSSGIYRVSWTVDARKLSGSERVAVSPPFELSCPTPMTFKMMILPKANSDRRGGASFRKSGGRGIVQVKCEAQTSEFAGGFLTFRITAGRNLEDATRKPARRAVKHNFTKSLVCALQDEHEEWDFRLMVDEASQTFAVCLEVL
uniref:Uncharacterized protein n=1 Tax=Alexandrium catenella TaxID=2925 RepID=A0A7S1RX80_ALECA|mmetsp:Transcript_7622/g.20673  ORF Transcript_7622/g.20673 Transcript_7622/m.20673 type:complete len:438 (+) Transcript_7622:60-1373(+)|eukprot:CAMPEP_0171177570 /NCGR_PEP_ID=MMETSP0790-20130122/12307_1 /TAXON_ID=2925 /ORGANISM="Alexandrium catenella, Strain OF101" /LENGTH=437 /DNA_ID=CAMNT_0011642471 /DNA_START=60 /DNA_END=1373 /DNA_ORIENTATION=-